MTVSRLLSVSMAVAMIVTALSLVGCSSETSTLTPVVGPEDEAGKQACFTSQRVAQTELFVWMNEGNEQPRMATPDGLVNVGAISESPVCPAGGEFVYNPVDVQFSCSIHGWPPD